MSRHNPILYRVFHSFPLAIFKCVQTSVTRDISLEDCILDLIDNSIDSLVRTRDIDISANLLLPSTPANGHDKNSLPLIDVTLKEKMFKIVDKCGRISRESALNEVFNFGHSKDGVTGQLGAYGIGLKRAIFKIGNSFEMISKTPKEGFKTKIKISEWSRKDEDITDWTIPITYINGASSKSAAGTSITIRELRPEVEMRLREGSFEGLLYSRIAQTYSLFLQRHVRVKLNGKDIEPKRIPIGISDEVEPAKEELEEQFKDGLVKVIIIAGLAARGPNQDWPLEPAGWYILCNGRVVVAANKEDLTGWGVGLPSFHYKFRGFVGLVFFQSKNPLMLPWTTTKRGLNRESPIYQKARNKMVALARPVITFINRMYPSEAPEERQERQIAQRTIAADIRDIVLKPTTTFKITPQKKAPPKTTVWIKYQAEVEDVEKIKKCIRQYTWSASKIGEHTFEHFLSTGQKRYLKMHKRPSQLYPFQEW